MNKSINIQKIVMTGMMTAVLSVLSILQIPMPTGVPITLQTFAVALCGYVLGAKSGAAAAAIYLVLGLIGVPVYAGMNAGAGVLFGLAGGFIFGFVAMACISGLSTGVKEIWKKLLIGAAGLLVCHLIGVMQFMFLSGNSFWQSCLMVSVPYLVKDVLSVAGACMVSIAVRKATVAVAL